MAKKHRPDALARRVRELRTGQGLTTRQLAERAGISQGAVSHLETGRRAPSLDLARRVASALGVTVDHLFAENNN
jgi:transcriptional regulator with XRE-family HTH domain